MNLLDAFTCACSDDMCGVNIVFNYRVILGTRARKNKVEVLRRILEHKLPLYSDASGMGCSCSI